MNLIDLLFSPGGSIVLGGVLTLSGGLATELWRGQRKRRNISNSLRTEIRETKHALELLKAAKEQKENGSITWEKYDTIEKSEFEGVQEGDGIYLKEWLFTQGLLSLEAKKTQIYDSNCGDIGHLSPDTASTVVKYYSSYAELGSYSDESIESAKERFSLQRDYGSRKNIRDELGEEGWHRYVSGVFSFRQILSTAEDAYEHQQKALEELEKETKIRRRFTFRRRKTD